MSGLFLQGGFVFFALVPFSNGIAERWKRRLERMHPWVSFVVHVISVPHVCFHVYFFLFLIFFSFVLDVEWILHRGDWRHFFHPLCLLWKYFRALLFGFLLLRTSYFPEMFDRIKFNSSKV